MTEEPERHYLHGDQNENNAEMWWCRRCDQFVAESHFSEDHHKNLKLSDYKKYRHEKKSFPIKMRTNPGKWRRPADAQNCLEQSQANRLV